MDSQIALHDWLRQLCSIDDMTAMTGDASFRRYFRVRSSGQTFVAMDASAERTSCIPFIAIANALSALNLKTPDIIASDLSRGFLLLSDLGDDLYLKILNTENAEHLYGVALDALSVLQTCREISNGSLPLFSADFMRQELQLFQEWFLQRYLKLTLTSAQEKMLAKTFHFLAESAASQPQVFMHRDFHSANLLALPNNQVGILDFQDAFIGPVTYDLVSLLRDCYIAWPVERVEKWVLQYREKIHLTSVSADQFLRWFDLMGVQRHLKALLTFSRKQCRDQNPHYLQHIPRTLDYVLSVSEKYSECKELKIFLEEVTLCVE